MDDLSFSGTGGIVVLIAYAVIMLGVGFIAGRDRGSDGTTTARGYYVSGGSLGFITLLFTLYATQYSGNAIVGYAPEAYRSGFGWWQSVPFMTAVITCYLLFAPRLYAVAKRRSFRHADRLRTGALRLQRPVPAQLRADAVGAGQLHARAAGRHGPRHRRAHRRDRSPTSSGSWSSSA